MAGAGLSGHHINPHEACLEALGIVREFMDHPIEELDVVARSVVNLLKHPLLSAVEGIGAAHCDVRPHAGRTIRNGSVRAYVETYLTEDNVIPLPARTDYITMPGCHLTPIVCGDTILDMANRLYEPNNPESLQIAGFNQAA